MKKSKIIFTFNAPAVLTFALFSLAALGLSILTGGVSNRMVFSIYRSSFFHPMTYVRLLCHVLGHTTFSHYVSNMALILALGPIVEERYGSWRLLFMFAVTALISFFGMRGLAAAAVGVLAQMLWLLPVLQVLCVLAMRHVQTSSAVQDRARRRSLFIAYTLSCLATLPLFALAALYDSYLAWRLILKLLP